jgi:hypothetical protein
MYLLFIRLFSGSRKNNIMEYLIIPDVEIHDKNVLLLRVLITHSKYQS